MRKNFLSCFYLLIFYFEKSAPVTGSNLTFAVGCILEAFKNSIFYVAWISSDYLESLLLPQRGENDSKQSDEFQAIF